MKYNPNDAHILGGPCALCQRAQPAGLLTLEAPAEWAPIVRCTNGKRDTIVACEACAGEWLRLGGRAVWRPFPPAGSTLEARKVLRAIAAGDQEHDRAAAAEAGKTDVARIAELLADPCLSRQLRRRLVRVLQLAAAGALSPEDVRESFEAGAMWAAELRRRSAN